MGGAYQDLTDRLDPAWISEWTKQEAVAMRNRGDDLKIYRVALESGMPMFEMDLRKAYLMGSSSHTSRYPADAVGEGNSSRKPFQNCFRPDRRPCDREGSVCSFVFHLRDKI